MEEVGFACIYPRASRLSFHQRHPSAIMSGQELTIEQELEKMMDAMDERPRRRLRGANLFLKSCLLVMYHVMFNGFQKKI